MPRTAAEIRATLQHFPKGTRVGSRGGMPTRYGMIDPLPGDEIQFEIEEGDEGVCLRGTNVSEKVTFEGCTFRMNDRQLLSSEYTIEGEGEAIIFKDPAPGNFGQKTTFAFKIPELQYEPVEFMGIFMLSRKQPSGYEFNDDQLQAIADESIGEVHPLRKISESLTDSRVAPPYTHCVVLSTRVTKAGIFATVEMRTGTPRAGVKPNGS